MMTQGDGPSSAVGGNGPGPAASPVDVGDLVVVSAVHDDVAGPEFVSVNCRHRSGSLSLIIGCPTQGHPANLVLVWGLRPSYRGRTWHYGRAPRRRPHPWSTLVTSLGDAAPVPRHRTCVSSEQPFGAIPRATGPSCCYEGAEAGTSAGRAVTGQVTVSARRGCSRCGQTVCLGSRTSARPASKMPAAPNAAIRPEDG
jgi:hypothetical protein